MGVNRSLSLTFAHSCMAASPDISVIIEAIKSGWTLIVAPVLGWFGGVFASRRQLKLRRKVIIRDLAGLPIECKAILIQFHDQRTHTLRADPYSPPMCVLVDRGIMIRGPSGGTYDAIDKYMSIHPNIWEVMDDWSATDQSINMVRQSIHERTKTS
jgi:hypothetical protein